MGIGLAELIVILFICAVPLAGGALALVLALRYLRRPHCPACKSRVLPTATVCPHCRRDLPARTTGAVGP